MERVGDIQYDWLERNLFLSHNFGDLKEDETRCLLDIIEDKIKDDPYFLWMVDVVDLTGMSPSARRICAERLRRLPDRAIAIVNAKFSQRILVKLVLTAVAMLDSTQRNNEVSFFEDRESAKAWLLDYAQRREDSAKSTIDT
ncbi:MAG: STAS/SEC14 domain-containing protein [Nannocystaceae bacterium]